MGKWGLMSICGEGVIPCHYEDLSAPSCGLLAFRRAKGDKVGFLNVQGKVVIPPKFHGVGRFDPASGLCYVREGKEGIDHYGLIDTAGEYVFAARYADIRYPPFERDGLIRIRTFESHKLYGYADSRGNIVLEVRYKDATPFSCGLAAVTYPNDWDKDDNEKHVYINRTGHKVLGPYLGFAKEERGFNADGIAAVCDLGKKPNYRFIDTLGRTLLKCPAGIWMEEFRSGLSRAGVYDDKKIGFMDIRGQWLVEPKYDEAFPFIRSYAIVGMNKRWGLIDAQGREAAPLRFKSSDHISLPSCQMIRFREDNGRFGYLSLNTGRVVVPAKFAGASDFSEGFAAVEDG